MNLANNPFLGTVGSIKGAKYRIRRIVAEKLKELLHVEDAEFVRRRMRTTGVNTVGSEKQQLDFWYREVDKQMQVTHQRVLAPTAPPAKKGLAKRISKSVGFATKVLL